MSSNIQCPVDCRSSSKQWTGTWELIPKVCKEHVFACSSHGAKINLKAGQLFGQLGLAMLLGLAGLGDNETSLSQNIYQATIILKIPKLKADPIKRMVEVDR